MVVNTRSGEERVEDADQGQPSSGSQGSSLSGLTQEQIAQITHDITEKLKLDPSSFIDQVRTRSGDVRGLEQASLAQQVPTGYFFLDEEDKTHNAQIRETKLMIHLSEFRKLSKDESSPKERQWLELCIETFKSQKIGREKAMAWIRYRIEAHHKVEMRNQEAKGVKFETVEDIYNRVMASHLRNGVSGMNTGLGVLFAKKRKKIKNGSHCSSSHAYYMRPHRVRPL